MTRNHKPGGPVSRRLRNAFCGAAAMAAAVAGLAPVPALAETLRIAMPADASALDPAFWLSAADQYLIDNLYPHLVAYKHGTDEWEVELSAAKSFEQVDDTTLRFELHPGMQWTNGYGEVTADDVKFSFERHLDPDLGSWNAKEFEWLEEVVVTGTYTGEIRLSRPAPEFVETPLARVPGAIISRKATEEAGGTFTFPPATYGAYKIDKIASGEKITLVANPDWHGETPDFDTVELIPISDENARVIAFNAGELDWLTTSVTMLPTLEAASSDEMSLSIRNTPGSVWLGIPSANPKLEDIRVREAIRKAVDVPTILAAIYDGRVEQSTGFAAPDMLGYRDIELPARDVEGARALLEEAGVSGLSLELDHSNSTEITTAAQIVQANLAEIGISVQVNPMDDGSFFNIHYDKGADKELYLVYWVGPPSTSYYYKWFTPGSDWNWEGFDNPDYVALLDKALSETDEAARGDMYRQLQEMLDASSSFLFLAHPPVVAVTRNPIQAAMLPDGQPVLAEFKKAGQ